MKKQKTDKELETKSELDRVFQAVKELKRLASELEAKAAEINEQCEFMFLRLIFNHRYQND